MDFKQDFTSLEIWLEKKNENVYLEPLTTTALIIFEGQIQV